MLEVFYNSSSTEVHFEELLINSGVGVLNSSASGSHVEKVYKN